MPTSTLPRPGSSYDSDADENRRIATNDELRNIVGISEDEENSYAHNAQQAQQEISDLENLYALDSAPEPTPKGDDTKSDDDKESGSAGSAKATDSDQLNEAEKVGNGYNPSTESTEPKGKKKGGLVARVRGNSKAKKMAVIMGAGTGLGALILVLFLILMLGSMLKIPDLGQNITSYEFARMSRQFADSAQSSTDEALALQGTDDATYTGLKGLYAAAQEKYDTMWTKLLAYRPGKIASTLQKSKIIQYNYSKPNIFGRQRLVSVSVLNDAGNYDEYKMASLGAARYVPVLKDILQIKNDAQFLANLQEPLDKSISLLAGDNVGPIVRGLVANEIRQKLGISLTAWTLSQFKDKTSESQAEVEETKERAQAVDENTTGQSNGSSGTDAVDKAEQAVEDAEKTSLASDTEVQQAINSNGVLQSVQSALKSSLEQSGLDKAAALLNPVEAIAQPICILGSSELNNSGATIDKQTTQTQAAYYHIASAGDQEKAGVQGGDPAQAAELDSAVGGLNDSLGNTATSNAYIRAAGGTVSTSGTMSPEASAGGAFTLADALLGSNTISGIINDVMNAACPKLTDPALSAALAAVNIVAGLADFGSTTAAEDAAAAAATEATTTTVKSMFTNLITRYLGQSAGRATELIYDTGKGTIKSAIGLGVLTIMARLIVLYRAGQLFSGFNMGNDLANEADAGGNIQGNELERIQLFGRPLTEPEVCQSNQQDSQFVYAQEASRSAYDRYLSPHYASSFLSRTAVMFSDDFNTSYGSGMLTSIGSVLLRPLTSLGWLSSLFMGKTFADATANCNDNVADYGDTQFGWSQDEENLIQSNKTYQPLENEEILVDSGEESAIAQKYANCFGYDYNAGGNGNFDPTDSSGDMTLADGPGEDGSLGTLLSIGEIIRDANGNVIDAGDPTQQGNYGLCSPSNLSYNSTDQLAYDPNSSSPKSRDLIFRFRLAMRYDTSIDQMSNLETVTAN